MKQKRFFRYQIRGPLSAKETALGIWLDKLNDWLILSGLQSCPSDVPSAETWHAVQIKSLTLLVSKPFRSISPSPLKQGCDAPQVCRRCDTWFQFNRFASYQVLP